MWSGFLELVGTELLMGVVADLVPVQVHQLETGWAVRIGGLVRVWVLVWVRVMVLVLVLKLVGSEVLVPVLAVAVVEEEL